MPRVWSSILKTLTHHTRMANLLQLIILFYFRPQNSAEEDDSENSGITPALYMSHESALLSIKYWLVNRDPYHGL